jgi:putative DNA primase/helicase
MQRPAPPASGNRANGSSLATLSNNRKATDQQIDFSPLHPAAPASGILGTTATAVIDLGRRASDLSAEGRDAANVVTECSEIEASPNAPLASATPFTTTVCTAESLSPAPDEAAIERRVAELSAYSKIKYATARVSAAKELGFPVGILDKLVREQRTNEDAGAGRAITFPVVKPWPSPVIGAAMLDALASALCSYVVLSPTQTAAVALWIVFTHCHDAFDVSPRLVVKSPQKRSGKTTLFSVLNRVVARPRGVSGITSSALLRLIELHCPTILMDEMDALMAGDREIAQALRGLINAGFNRALAAVTMNIKTTDGGYEPREFSSWAPLALAGIGDLPDTVRDRSIEIEMKRKLKTETVKRLRQRDGADLTEIARKLARWSLDNLDTLRAVEPRMPDGLNDRAADAWEPLVAVAELAGGDWPGRARAAALHLSGNGPGGATDNDIETVLLSDIRDAFARKGTDKLSGESLTNLLTALDGRPWAEWKHGKPLTKFQLARRLADYKIRPSALDFGEDEGRLKGYRVEDFEDVFSRYLPSRPISTRELVIGPEAPAETPDAQLVTSKPGHEFETAEIPSNSPPHHEFTSSNVPPHAPDRYSTRTSSAAPETRT